MSCTDIPGTPEARAQELIDATTSAIFSHMSTVLSADHRQLLAFLLALDRLQATHKLTDNEMSLWLGDTVTDKLQSSVDDVCPRWMSREVAHLLCMTHAFLSSHSQIISAVELTH